MLNRKQVNIILAASLFVGLTSALLPVAAVSPAAMFALGFSIAGLTLAFATTAYNFSQPAMRAASGLFDLFGGAASQARPARGRFPILRAQQPEIVQVVPNRAPVTRVTATGTPIPAHATNVRRVIEVGQPAVQVNVVKPAQTASGASIPVKATHVKRVITTTQSAAPASAQTVKATVVNPTTTGAGTEIPSHARNVSRVLEFSRNSSAPVDPVPTASHLSNKRIIRSKNPQQTVRAQQVIPHASVPATSMGQSQSVQVVRERDQEPQTQGMLSDKIIVRKKR